MGLQKLKVGIQTYNWGKIGHQSEVAKYLVSSGQLKHEQVNENGHYAELWVGTHVKTPCMLDTHDKEISLLEFTQNHPELLGDKITKNYASTLPFLMKVLSIGHPLQLQIHPTKEEAKELHKRNPQAFLDENHKPEMAVALTSFSALCGFRPANQILEVRDSDCC